MKHLTKMKYDKGSVDEEMMKDKKTAVVHKRIRDLKKKKIKSPKKDRLKY